MQITRDILSGDPASGRDGFLKGNAELIGISVRFLDLTLVTAGAMIAHYIRFDSIALQPGLKLALLVALLACGAIFPLFGIYKPWRGMSIELEARTVLIAWITVAILLPLIVYLNKSGEDYSRLWYGYWIISTGSLLILSRYVIRKAAQWARSKGFNTRNVAIIGTGELARRVSNNLASNDWTGIRVVGFFDRDERPSSSDNPDSGEEEQKEENSGLPLPYIGSVLRLSQMLRNQNNFGCGVESDGMFDSTRIDQVWVALPSADVEKIRDVCNLLDDTAVSVVLVPDIFLDNLLNHSVDNLAGMSVVNLRSSPLEGTASTLKMLEDYTIAGLALILMFFPMVLIALAIKLESKGPVFFKQRRYGIDGREITVWKFRSMTVLEDGDEVNQATKGDARVTRVGAFLRQSSLDELPQFINVLQGRMSVVGPRPHAVAHNEKYRKLISRYMWRCKVKPGITGWAQVNGWRGETDTPEKMENRVEYDLEYLKTWSIWLDIKIIVRTFACIFKSDNAY